MMLKKILAFILALQLFCIVAYSVPNDLYKGDSAFDFMYAAEGGAEKNDGIIVKLLDYLDMLDIENYKPDDMSSYDDYIRAIAKIARIEASKEALLDLGLIKQNSNSVFTMEDVVFTGLRLTGYDLMLPGGKSEFALASNAGLMYKVNYKAEAVPDKRSFYQLIYNILSIECKEKSLFSNNSGYELVTIEPLLKRLYNIEFKEGVVTGVCGRSIYAGADIGENQVEIDRSRYNVYEAEGFSAAIGMHSAYFLEDPDSDLPKALFCEGFENKNTVVKIKAYHFNKISDSNIEYYDSNNKLCSASINADTVIVYNGNNLGAYTPALFNSKYKDTAHITLIDNDKSGIMNVIFIWDYTHIGVSKDVGAKGVINFKYNMTYNGKSQLDTDALKDSGKVEIFKNGAPVTVDSIRKDDIVSIATGMGTSGKTYTRIIVSKNVFTAAPETIERSDKGTIYTIDGKEYLLLKEYEEVAGKMNGGVLPKPGEMYTFIANSEGIICDVLSAEYDNAILIAVSSPKGIRSKIQIKVFSADYGKFMIYNLAERVKFFNGVGTAGNEGVNLSGKDTASRLKDMQEIVKWQNPVDSNSNPTDTRFLMKYSLNENGEINRIYVPLDTTGTGRADVPGNYGYSLTLDASFNSVRIYNHIVDGAYCIDDQTPIIVLPPCEKADDEKMYSVKERSNYPTDWRGVSHIKLYSVDDFWNVGFAVYINPELRETISASTSAMLIDKVVMTTSAEEGEILKISGYKDMVYTNVYCDDPGLDSYTGIPSTPYWPAVKISDLKRGDVVQFVETGDTVTNFKVIFRESERSNYQIQYASMDSGIFNEDGKITTEPFSSATGWIKSLEVVYARYVRNNGLSIVVDLSNDGTKQFTNYVKQFASRKLTVYSIEPKNKHIEEITLDDILEGENVVLHKKSTQTEAVYVYR